MNRIRRAVRGLSLLLLAALIVTPLAQITKRGVFNVPLAGAEELAKYFLICLTFIAAPYVTREGGQIRMEEFNPQSQPRIEWPAAFPVVRSYLDQLVRWKGLSAERTTAIASALDAAERQSGRGRRDALNALAREVDRDVAGAADGERVKTMAAAIRKLAAASR